MDCGLWCIRVLFIIIQTFVINRQRFILNLYVETSRFSSFNRNVRTEINLKQYSAANFISKEMAIKFLLIIGIVTIILILLIAYCLNIRNKWTNCNQTICSIPSSSPGKMIIDHMDVLVSIDILLHSNRSTLSYQLFAWRWSGQSTHWCHHSILRRKLCFKII